MKKLIILIILTVLLASCAPAIVTNGGTVEHSTITRGEPSPTANVELAYPNETIVYVTKSGTKYHELGCSHLSKSQIPISLEQAHQQDFAPCSVCHPATEAS